MRSPRWTTRARASLTAPAPRLDTPDLAWGVATGVPGILLAGAGARRGGGVSGVAGHDAAQAVLASR